MSSVASNRSGASRQEELSEHYAPIGGQQSGYVLEIESEEPGNWQDHGGPSSSRPQQQVTVEFNDANLARVDEQPLVRGPLKQMETASDHMRDKVKAMNKEVDQLHTSILRRQEMVQSLSDRIADMQEAQQQGLGGLGELGELQQLEIQLDNTQQRIQQEEQRIQNLVDHLKQEGLVFDGALRARGLVISRAGWQTRYPARADMAEDTEGVPEEARPHLNF